MGLLLDTFVRGLSLKAILLSLDFILAGSQFVRLKHNLAI